MSPYVLCLQPPPGFSQGADQRRAQLQTGDVPIALLHQPGVMAAFSSRSWCMIRMMIEKKKHLLSAVEEYCWNVERRRVFYEPVGVSS